MFVCMYVCMWFKGLYCPNSWAKAQVSEFGQLKQKSLHLFWIVPIVLGEGGNFCLKFKVYIKLHLFYSYINNK